VAKLFLDTVYPSWLALDIVSDRDSRLTSKFWVALSATLGTKLSVSTAFHPQSYGNAERVNRVMEDMLRHVVANLIGASILGLLSLLSITPITRVFGPLRSC